MGTDQMLRLLHATQEVTKRKLGYGQVITALCDQNRNDRPSSEPVFWAEAFLDQIEFATMNWMELRRRDDLLAIINASIESFILSFIPDAGESPTRRSLPQELLSLMPSA
jgi:hypothetical protein